MARLRNLAGLIWLRSFGLKVGWLTSARTSPVATSSTMAEPEAALCFWTAAFSSR